MPAIQRRHVGKHDRLLRALRLCAWLCVAPVWAESPAPAATDTEPVEPWAEAIRLFEAGDLAGASRVCLARPAPPADARTGFAVTRLLLYADQLPAADDLAARLAHRFPKEPEAALARALVLVKRGDAEGASDAVAAALRMNPRSAYTHYLAARIASWSRRGIGRDAWARMMAEADKFPEFHLMASDPSRRKFNEEDRRQLERFLEMAGAYDDLAKGIARRSLAMDAEAGAATMQGRAEMRAPLLEWPMILRPGPVVQVSINGGEPGPFLLDTGAAALVVDRTWARSAGLTELSSTIDVGTFSGRTFVGLARVGEVSLPGLSRRDVLAVVSDLAGVRASYESKADGEFSPGGREAFRNLRGVLGAAALFDSRVLWFDVARGRVVAADSARRLPAAESFHWHPFLWQSGVPHVPVRAGGAGTMAFLLDTGMQGPDFMVGPSLVSLAGWRRRSVGGLVSTALDGVPRETQVVNGEVELVLWPGEAREVVVRTREPWAETESEPVFHSFTRGGVVGWSFLMRRSPVFDYARNRIGLRAEATEAETRE